MADAVRPMCHKHSPPDMLADFKRRPQHEFTERSTRKLGVVLALDRDALPGQVASMWAGGPHSHGQLGPGIDLRRVNLDRAAALAVRDCLRGHDRQAVGSCAALVPAM
jgi:hypothetical protein